MAERNRLLLAGGFAPAYLEPLYDGDPMRPLRESLRRLLAAHEPIPTLIVDGLWNVIEANRAASLLWDGIDPALLEPPVNMLCLGVHPGGLPSISLVSREDADDTLRALVDEVSSYLPADAPPACRASPWSQ